MTRNVIIFYPSIKFQFIKYCIEHFIQSRMKETHTYSRRNEYLILNFILYIRMYVYVCISNEINYNYIKKFFIYLLSITWPGHILKYLTFRNLITPFKFQINSFCRLRSFYYKCVFVLKNL